MSQRTFAGVVINPNVNLDRPPCHVVNLASKPRKIHLKTIPCDSIHSLSVSRFSSVSLRAVTHTMLCPPAAQRAMNPRQRAASSVNVSSKSIAILIAPLGMVTRCYFPSGDWTATTSRICFQPSHQPSPPQFSFCSIFPAPDSNFDSSHRAETFGCHSP